MATTIRIGHASIDENGNITGVQAGDQTGSEVFIKENYDITARTKKFGVLLRPKTVQLALASADACEAGCNNNNIGYNQNSRYTLYNKAKDVDFDLSKITEPCNTDCSAFMAVCAIAGGAKVSYEVNTESMKSAFGDSGYYDLLTDDFYFDRTDYLKRGDILVTGTKGHTIMILDYGCLVPENEIFWSAVGSFSTVKIAVNIKDILTNSLSATAEIIKNENGQEQIITDEKELKMYEWSYKLSSLSADRISEGKQKKLGIQASTFSISGLSANNSYILNVIASQNESTIEFSSADIIFTTPKVYPSAVRNLEVEFSNTDSPVRQQCKIKFTEPASWGNTSLDNGYRVSAIVNGNTVAYSDSLILAGSNTVSKIFNINDVFSLADFNYDDIIQIGIQPWLKIEDEYMFNKNFFACSQPFYIQPSAVAVDKSFIRQDSIFKRLLIHSITRKE